MTDAKALSGLESMLAGEYQPPPKDSFPRTAPLFGGIAGLELPAESYELAPGLALSRTYAHVILPAVMAFARPEKPNAHHPAPWATLASGGVDITAELSLAAGEPPFGFDRLNTLWFVTALLRLRLGNPLLMMVLADRPFHTVPKAPAAASLIPIELHPQQLQLGPSRPLTVADLDWIRDNLLGAGELMKVPVFNRVLEP